MRSPEPAPTHTEAVRNVSSALPVKWARTFNRHTQDDGTTAYVDQVSGILYPNLPALHPEDGKPA